MVQKKETFDRVYEAWCEPPRERKEVEKEALVLPVGGVAVAKGIRRTDNGGGALYTVNVERNIYCFHNRDNAVKFARKLMGDVKSIDNGIYVATSGLCSTTDGTTRVEYCVIRDAMNTVGAWTLEHNWFYTNKSMSDITTEFRVEELDYTKTGGFYMFLDDVWDFRLMK